MFNLTYRMRALEAAAVADTRTGSSTTPRFAQPLLDAARRSNDRLLADTDGLASDAVKSFRRMLRACTQDRREVH